MNTQQEHEDPERREGLGGRVRRFIDSELNRARDKNDTGTDERDPDYRDAPDRVPQRATASDRPNETGTLRHEPVVTVSGDAPERAAQPVTIVPTDTAYDSTTADSPVHDSPVHDSPVHTSPPHETRSPAGNRSSEEAAADSSAERVGLLNDPGGLRDQWQRVQGTFVDDPQRAVQEASALVERTLQEIHQNITHGQTSNPTSTEDLRVSFQRYREFFQRLLSA